MSTITIIKGGPRTGKTTAGHAIKRQCAAQGCDAGIVEVKSYKELCELAARTQPASQIFVCDYHNGLEVTAERVRKDVKDLHDRDVTVYCIEMTKA